MEDLLMVQVICAVTLYVQIHAVNVWEVTSAHAYKY